MSRALSKRLSLVLRHDPAHLGLTLDAGGWVSVDDLLRQLAAHGTPVTREALDALVASNDKQRFALVDGRIRANQGHSVPVDLGLVPRVPPDVLFHGTATRSLDAILREGLRPMSRQHVHLSADRETAVRVGQRHGRPVVLGVDAAALHAAGTVFWRREGLSDATVSVGTSRRTGDVERVGPPT